MNRNADERWMKNKHCVYTYAVKGLCYVWPHIMYTSHLHVAETTAPPCVEM